MFTSLSETNNDDKFSYQYIRQMYLYIDDDVSGSCGGKYDTSMPTMNSSSSNIIHQASSSHPLFGFENCGSSSAIEELNFSVLHNVSSQNNLSNETRKLLKKRWDLKKNYNTNGSNIYKKS